MIFCKRQTCQAGAVTEFYMPLSCLKWKVKNYTQGDIYVSLGAYAPDNNMRIAPGAYDVVIDRDAQTGSRRTSRRIFVYADAAGEVEVVYV